MRVAELSHATPRLQPPDDPLAAWQPDAAFAAALDARGARADIVSFDVFDTALTRRLDSPADVFAETERRLAELIGTAADGFAEQRELAEMAARSAHQASFGAEEIGFDDILDALIEATPRLAPHRATLQATEFAVERDLLAAVPDILEATRRLAAAGRPFIFVSDMYLPAAIIAEALARAGYAGWHDLFVSSETGATKASGRQWTVIRGALAGQASSAARLRILHVGDDAHSDGSQAQAAGIDTLLYTRARSAKRLGSRLTPDILPFSRLQRAVQLVGRAVPMPPDAGDAAAWRDLGRSLGGIVCAGFVSWLADRVRRHGITALAFGARDGWLIQQAWRQSGMPDRLGVPDRYLCVSRRTLNFARFYLDSSDVRLPAALLAFVSTTDGTVTVGAALARLKLPAETESGRALAAAFGTLEAKLTWPDGSRLFETILQRHAREVRRALAEGHAAALGYLRQEGFDQPGRLGFVDLGWHGSLQRSLQRLQLRPRDSLCGFYYGLWQAALGNRHGAGMMESAFASEFIPPGEQPGMLDAVGLLEELHTAPHGTVTGYRQQDGRWQPVFAEHPQELAQYGTVAKPFQEGALETVRALFGQGEAPTLPVALATVTPAAACAAIDAVCLSPTVDERRLLGGIGHCAGFDHVAFEPLAPPDCPEDETTLIDRHLRCGWRTGTMLAWYEAAPGPRRAQLAALARSLLAHQGPRNLRQFG